MLVTVPYIVGMAFCSFDWKQKIINISIVEKRMAEITCLATAAGFLINRVIEQFTGWNVQTGMIAVVSPERMVSQIADLIKAVFAVYGVGGHVNLISLAGISVSFKFLYMIISVFLVPVFWLLFFKKISNKLWKWFVSYSWISNLCMSYLFVSTTAGGAGSAYHILTIYINNTLLLTGLLLSIWENDQVKKVSVIFLMMIAGIIHTVYFVQNREAVGKQTEADRQLITYFQENKLSFGYATFWNAYKFTLLTSGEIEMAAYQDDPNQPYYWLTSRKWYEPDYHNGQTFVLLGDGQSVAEKYYIEAKRVDRVGEYTVLVYEQNISKYPELAADLLQEGMECEIGIDSLYLENKAYKSDGKVVLEETGRQFGPYMELAGGSYKVHIKGKGLRKAAYTVLAGREHQEQDLSISKVTDREVVYDFYLNDFMTDVEFLTYNEKKQAVVIENITICFEKKAELRWYFILLTCSIRSMHTVMLKRLY